MTEKRPPIVFTPDNEPYLWRDLLFHFDQIISSILAQNATTAPKSHGKALTDHQRMACQVIAQAISVMLSMRELIRQGYLFGAHVLLRAMVERAAILLYMHLHPEEIDKWNRGWHSRDAPGLSAMLEAIQRKQSSEKFAKGSDLTADMNSLLHAKPDSAPWNLISLGNGGVGHAVSKILNRPELCDDLCKQVIPWGAVIQAMMAHYFPSNEPNGSV